MCILGYALGYHKYHTIGVHIADSVLAQGEEGNWYVCAVCVSDV